MRPLCRYCAKPIPKRTGTLVFSPGGSNSGHEYWRQIDARPFTAEDAQRHTNHPIVRIRKVERPDGPFVAEATFWDGTYRDEYFCKDQCAQFFGRMVAEYKKDIATQSYWTALKAQLEKESKA